MKLYSWKIVISGLQRRTASHLELLCTVFVYYSLMLYVLNAALLGLSYVAAETSEPADRRQAHSPCCMAYILIKMQTNDILVEDFPVIPGQSCSNQAAF